MRFTGNEHRHGWLLAGRATLVAALALTALLVLPPVAGAVLSGSNGRILFASGRDGGDAQAKLYLRTTVGSAGGGSAGEPIAASAGQHRHPTWSPDRTKIAYSRGDSGCATDCDIYVLDISTPGAAPEKLTDTANITEDRPAWSPDGTRIAYESEVTNGSGQTDVLVQPAAGGAPLNLTNTPAAAAYEGKPAWTPDSETIFYHQGNPAAAGEMDIIREPAAGGTTVNVTSSVGVSEFQPSVSPDGTMLCFTRGDFSAVNGTQVVVSLLNGGGQTALAVNDPAAADYNCTWSPDGTKIAWVQGAFTAGDLVMANSDNSSLAPIFLETSVAFDGNPDWAPDGTAVCDPVTVDTEFNTAVTIPLVCNDTGPAYERTGITENISTPPSAGTLGTLQQGAPTTEPSSVTYTPNTGFSGTDTFEFNGFGGGGFASSVTATINIAPAPAPPDDTPPDDTPPDDTPPDDTPPDDTPPDDTPPDRTAPTLSLGGKKKQKLRGSIKLVASCDEGCEVRAAGKLKVKRPRGAGGAAKRTFDLRPASAGLGADEQGVLKLKLPKRAKHAARRALASDAKVKAKLVVSGDDAAGNRATGKRTVKLKLKRKRR